nr:hypothetical protein [uncultured Roseateles sp.]
MSPGLDFSSFVNLRRLDANSSSVWLMRLPTMLWKQAAAAQERDAVVNKLTAAFPYRSLWLSDWVTSKEPRWLRLAENDDLYSSCEGLDHGGWVLLFFENEQALPEQHLEQIVSDAPAAKQLLCRFAACAAILSFVDDDEWLVAIADWHLS